MSQPISIRGAAAKMRPAIWGKSESVRKAGRASSGTQYVGAFIQKTVPSLAVLALRSSIALPAGITSLP